MVSIRYSRGETWNVKHDPLRLRVGPEFLKTLCVCLWILRETGDTRGKTIRRYVSSRQSHRSLRDGGVIAEAFRDKIETKGDDVKPWRGTSRYHSSPSKVRKGERVPTLKSRRILGSEHVPTKHKKWTKITSTVLTFRVWCNDPVPIFIFGRKEKDRSNAK